MSEFTPEQMVVALRQAESGTHPGGGGRSYSPCLEHRRLSMEYWLPRGKPQPPWVLPSDGGTPLDHHNVAKRFKRILKAAGLPGHSTPIA
jgi:hypothetical protein